MMVDLVTPSCLANLVLDRSLDRMNNTSDSFNLELVRASPFGAQVNGWPLFHPRPKANPVVSAVALPVLSLAEQTREQNLFPEGATINDVPHIGHVRSIRQ